MRRRCLVTACRLTRAPAVSCVIDIGPRSDSRPTMRRRVSSPSAAKSAAERLPGWERPAVRALAALAKVLRDQVHLVRPAALVRGERLCATRQRDPVEAGL